MGYFPQQKWLGSNTIRNMSEHDSESQHLIGRESTVVPGHFGDPLTVTYAEYSRGNGSAQPNRPIFVCLHGWGSNEQDIIDMMRYVAPYNDYVSLRAPLTLEPAPSKYQPGAYSWFHDAVPVAEDLDYDAYAAAQAVNTWVLENIPENRAVVPLGFSQGGLLAIHLLRLNPERYRAAVTLSGFVALARIPETAPADERMADLRIPVYFGFGDKDKVVSRSDLYAAEAWLEEHTWLKSRCYRGLDHAVNLEELSDLRQWLALHDIAPGIL